MFSKVKKMKNHVYRHRARYTALVTIPVTVIVMELHYKPYVEVGKAMAVFLYDHGLGKEFMDLNAASIYPGFFPPFKRFS